MIPRTISAKALGLVEKFPILTITGPRQSGKTTLIKNLFKDYAYYSLESPDDRQLIKSDPKGFFGQIESPGIILDEVQQVPELFSYIQTFSDNHLQIKFVLSGSQNFRLLEKVSQSLAGRTAILNLLPLSLMELERGGQAINNYEKAIYYGGYPRLFDREIDPADFYPNYVQTYVERDLRMIKNIQDLDLFIKFVQLCAGRIGQLLNLSSLATDAGITVNTAKAWLSVLKTSYIAFTLSPYHRNYNKRLVKMPKLYFYDTGLACSLLGIENEKQITTYFNKGGLFENLIVGELLKGRFNEGKKNNLHFWRDNHGREIDCIMEYFEGPLALEVKSTATFNPQYLGNLRYWNNLTGNKVENSYLVYAGSEKTKTKWGNLVPWNKLHEIPAQV